MIKKISILAIFIVTIFLTPAHAEWELAPGLVLKTPESLPLEVSFQPMDDNSESPNRLIFWNGDDFVGFMNLSAEWDVGIPGLMSWFSYVQEMRDGDDHTNVDIEDRGDYVLDSGIEVTHKIVTSTYKGVPVYQISTNLDNGKYAYMLIATSQVLPEADLVKRMDVIARNITITKN